MKKLFSVALLTLLLTSVLALALNIQPVKSDGTWTETIYIMADGSIDPPDSSITTVDNVTYTLTGNIVVDGPPYRGIVVQRDNIIIDGAGYTVETREFEREFGITLEESNVTLKNVEVKNFAGGVYISGSSNNVQRCSITNNYRGIEISSSSNNSISENNIIGQVHQVCLYRSSNNSIVGNNIIDGRGCDIYLHMSSNNSIQKNNIAGDSQHFIRLSNSSGNVIYHNNFITAREGIYSYESTDIWDNGYPSGGNYWGDYAGADLHRGPEQNEHGSDDIGDMPYVIDADNIDHYPLMNPYGASPPLKYTLTITTTVGGTTDPAPRTYSYTANSTVQVMAIPEANFSFEYWELDSANVGSINPISVFMNKNYTLHANFSRPHEPAAEFFVWSPYVSIYAGTPVTFNASFSVHGWNGTHTMPITEYRWNFGDGNITSTYKPAITHIYTRQGTFNITLAVLDSAGLNSSISKNIFVIMPTFISISTSSPSTFAGFKVDINGTLSDLYGNSLENQTVVIHYNFLGADTWIPITSDTTDNHGHYHVEWVPQATGHFTIRATWAGNTTHIGATNTVTLNSLSYENQYVFTVESNSTISALAFNITNWTLSFDASGPEGTTGYVKVTVAKSFAENPQNIRVYVDGIQTEYAIAPTGDSWLLTFTYMHSAHEITITLGQTSTPFVETPFGKVILYAVPITAIISLIVFSVLKKKKRNPLDRKNTNLNSKPIFFHPSIPFLKHPFR